MIERGKQATVLRLSFIHTVIKRHFVMYLWRLIDLCCFICLARFPIVIFGLMAEAIDTAAGE